MCRFVITASLFLGLLSPLAAQPPAISVDQLPCIAQEENSVVTARVEPERGGDTVRLYFRRLHHVVEDFYFVHMEPDGGGVYWGVLPKPEDRRLVKKVYREDGGGRGTGWADWWVEKEASKDRDPNGDLDAERVRERATVGKLELRAWLDAPEPAELQDWLEGLENEPAEYFVAVFDSHEQFVAKSDVWVTRVTPDCDERLNEEEAGAAQTLAVGETAPWQVDQSIFHWKCDGVVSRIGTADWWLAAAQDAESYIGWNDLWEADLRGPVTLETSEEEFRADGICRACVVYIPLWAAGLAPAAILATEVPEASDTSPPRQ